MLESPVCVVVIVFLTSSNHLQRCSFNSALVSRIAIVGIAFQNHVLGFNFFVVFFKVSFIGGFRKIDGCLEAR